MKKLRFTFFLFGVVVLVLSGCTSTPSTPSTPTSKQTTSQKTTTLEERTPLSPAGKFTDEFAVNIQFRPDKDTPAFFRAALKQRKPIFVHFYAEGDAISDAMALGISELQTKYKDKVIFLLLNGSRPATYGSLSQQLPLKYVPQTFIFNSRGTIIRSFVGYVDKERLEQAVYDAISKGY